MALNKPRQSTDGSEAIYYEALVAEKMLLIAITRETIEDYLQVETTTPEERLAYVNENLELLTACAAEKVNDVPDATVVMLYCDDLPPRT